jgi:hypothetical protein
MKTKAQSTIEYIMLFSIIVAALVSMQVYVKRAAQGGMSRNLEQLSEGSVYSPGATNSLSMITTTIHESTSSLSTDVDTEKYRTTDAFINQETRRTEQTLPLADEPRRW